MKVRERLVTLLSAYDIKLKDVAKLIGVSRVTFSKKLKCQAMFNENEMKGIQQFYFPDENLETLFEIKEIN